MRPGGIRTALSCGALALVAACAPAPPVENAPRALRGEEQALLAHVEVLASDAFAGREVGTIGEGLTLDYMQRELAAAGLQSGTHDPGNPWREPVRYDRGQRTIDTYNLIGRLPGTEPQAGAVLLVAHWDHLGFGVRCRPKGADRICNGAVDNATGLAMMIEISRRLVDGPRPRRDVYFLATGGEEDGLRGALAFVQDPPVPLGKFVAVFNLDTEGVAPAGAPAVVLGTPTPPGIAGLTALIERTARDEGVRIVPPDSGNLRLLKRQDGWVFDAVGVPAVIVSAAFAQQTRFTDFMRTRYHRANDEISGVELGGTADMVRLHVELLRRAADPAQFAGRVTGAASPAWNAAKAPGVAIVPAVAENSEIAP
ncbi:MAG TPA: M20/M25/M40 family metallo-hydrolase [Croceicoccus sp.]|nr:M20/M25/M40 family metallo-hydrolase [Croceicoccus sp.]